MKFIKEENGKFIFETTEEEVCTFYYDALSKNESFPYFDEESLDKIEEVYENYHKKKDRYATGIKVGYDHTFCGMNYSLSDNPYKEDSPEYNGWIEGYKSGIEET